MGLVGSPKGKIFDNDVLDVEVAHNTDDIVGDVEEPLNMIRLADRSVDLGAAPQRILKRPCPKNVTRLSEDDEPCVPERKVNTQTAPWRPQELRTRKDPTGDGLHLDRAGVWAFLL